MGRGKQVQAISEAKRSFCWYLAGEVQGQRRNIHRSTEAQLHVQPAEAAPKDAGAG